LHLAAHADIDAAPRAAAGRKEGFEGRAGSQVVVRVDRADREAGLAGQAARLHAQEILDDALHLGRLLAGMGQQGEAGQQEERKSLEERRHVAVREKG
jgi:hypothetical protein